MFRPARSSKRLKQAAPAAYFVATNKRNDSLSLVVRITSSLAHSAGITDRSAMRFDVGSDSDKGLMRLTPVAQSNRHWCRKGRSNQSFYVHCSYSDEVEEFFPKVSKIAPLEVVDISREDGITIQLPKP
jgi:hypothetical protein